MVVRIFSTLALGEGGRLLSHGLRERNGGVNVRKERTSGGEGAKTITSVGLHFKEEEAMIVNTKC